VNYLLKTVLLAYSVLFLSFIGITQNNSPRFDHLDIRSGLSQSSVNAIVQDKNGFIWIGTQDGLNKFDGYNFQVFYHNPANQNSITNNYIQDLLIDTLGNLWVATDYGVSKINTSSLKVNRIYKSDTSAFHIPFNATKRLAKDQLGNIYIATEKGGLIQINTFNNQQLEISTTQFLSSNSDILSLFVDNKNNLWIGSEKGEIAIYNVKTQQANIYYLKDIFNKKDVISSVLSIAQDKNGIVWIGTTEGLIYSDNFKNYGNIQFSIYENAQKSLLSTVINDIHILNQDIWLATALGVNKLSLKNNESELFSNNKQIPTSLIHNLAQCIFKDRTGTIWIGTNSGISKFDEDKKLFYHTKEITGQSNGLIGDNVWTFFEDSNENLWIGTRDGLNLLHKKENRWYFFDNISNTSIYANNKSVMSVYQDSKNRLYIGTADGVYFVQQNEKDIPIKFIPVNYSNEYFTKTIENKIYKIKEDRNNNLWIGSKKGLGYLSSDRNQSYFFETKDGLSNATVRDIYEDDNGTIWIGTEGGFSKILYVNKDSIVFKTYHYEYNNPSGLSNNMVISIMQRDPNILWLGTYGGGLNKFDIQNETFKSYREEDGLSNNVVYGVLADNKGNIWMSTNKGLSVYNSDYNTFRNYSENDGLQSSEFNIGAYFQNKTGEMFFGGINGYNYFNPEEIKTNQKPPQIVLTRLKISNQYIEPNSKSILKQPLNETKQLNFSYQVRDFTIEFVALHFTHPEKNKYAYKMVGFNEDWVVTENQRFAQYTNLDAGEYTFIVKGSNSDGVWSENVAAINIIITPPFWNTWLFRIIAVLVVIGMFFIVYFIRITQIKQQNEALEKQVQERTAEVINQKEKIEQQKNLLQIEKEKTEKLLLNILPQETVDELKTKGKASARNYRNATVMFTDFVGFTQISEKLRPQELVEKLDAYFIKFDEIIAQHNIEKIKTIGDSYMCAGGVPIRNRSNPIDVVLAGLKIQAYIQELINNAKPGEEPWKIRIGINSGDLIAGVVGIKRFAYDIWGDTVNVASRMEMSGEIGKVNISGSTYEKVKEFFDCTYRGKIEAKNKGEIDMYFVERIKPELSQDELGTEPNDMFWEYVNLQLYSSLNYKKAEKFIIKTLEDGLSPDLHYHNINHMKDVCASVERIAKAEGIKGEDLFLLKTAALYHDAGFVHQYAANEPIGAKMAEETLLDYGYSEEQIQTVQRLILATKVPHNPADHLEQIICDADLDYLGRDDFYPISDGLRKEFLAHGVIQGNKSWDELQIKFLSMHKYFTMYSINNRQPNKQKRLEEIKKRYEENNYDS
jgi:ligand-binding sensor domain-containing protein/class 3 adenylate cyclase/predicted metal-dependent HD superfamily phosphohydrolase